MDVVLSSLHSLLEYDYYTIGAFFLAFATGTYILALFSYLLIERPVMNLERLFLPHHK
jgi:peptidoglycan/LPS O-acetylase OafA/YrhL